MGDTVGTAGGGRSSTVTRLLVAGTDQTTAAAGDAVTITLADEIDISRGDALADPAAKMATADQFQAHMVWLDPRPLVAGRTYLFKLGTATVSGSITRIRHRIDVNTGDKLSATDLSVNDVAVVNISLQSAVPFTPFADSRCAGRLHRDRPPEQRHGRGRHDRLRPDPVRQHCLAGAERRPPVPGGNEGSTPKSYMVHWPVRLGQVYDRQRPWNASYMPQVRHTYMLDGDNVAMD